VPRSLDTPPVRQRAKTARPPMLKALQANALDQVRALVESTPKVASEPFWDHDLEPPLCCAVRLQCDASIVQALLEHGANPADADLRGRTPMYLLRELEVPILTNQWEMLLQPFVVSMSFGEHLASLANPTVPGDSPDSPNLLQSSSFPGASWYDALLIEEALEGSLSAQEAWFNGVLHVLGGSDSD